MPKDQEEDEDDRGAQKQIAPELPTARAFLLARLLGAVVGHRDPADLLMPPG
jgi:hypothetical protein